MHSDLDGTRNGKEIGRGRSTGETGIEGVGCHGGMR